MKIENKTKCKVILWRIKKLLKVIPQEDLYGLDSISIFNEIYDRTVEKGSKGAYFPQGGKRKKPYIEMYLNNIASDSLTVQYSLLLFPIVGAMLMADTLYHEIGHHVLHKKAGFKKNVQEVNAETYAVDKISLCIRPLKPFKLIFYYLAMPFYLMVMCIYKVKAIRGKKLDKYDLITLGRCYEYLKNVKNAKNIAEELIKRGEKSEPPYIWMGDYFRSQKDYGGAHEWYLKAAQLSPYNKKARMKLSALKSVMKIQNDI